MKKILIILILSIILVSGCIQERDYIDTELKEREEPIKCGYCQYPIDEYTCGDYVCCKDSDCDDNDPNTVDLCINSQTRSAKCDYIRPGSAEVEDTTPTMQDVITGAPQPTDECSTNSDCDDNDVSTKDICSGIPKKCYNTKITMCLDNDGYCPPGCVYSYDNDCEEIKRDKGNLIEQYFSELKPLLDGECKWNSDCLSGFVCFEGYCIGDSKILKNYIDANYEKAPCFTENKICNTCLSGKLGFTAYLYVNGTTLEFCKECAVSFEESNPKCKEEYTCLFGKCIK